MENNTVNIDIKNAIKESGIRYWQVALQYGITDGNFSRKLRTELSDEEKNKILKIIEKIKKERKN